MGLKYACGLAKYVCISLRLSIMVILEGYFWQGLWNQVFERDGC